MKNMKRFLAVAMAATMVIGSSVTAFADDDPYSSVGTGENEGHVNKHVISVTLPTVPANTTPFSYTVDPERLVSETSGSRYGSTTFTDDAKRDGVYFLNGTAATDATYAKVDTTTVTAPVDGTTYYTKSGDTYTEATGLTAWAADTEYYTQTSAGTAASSSYDNKSGALTATSKSSADVELTVEVAVANDGNVTLVDAAPSTDGYTAATVADEDAFKAGTYYTKSGTTYTKATEYAANTEYYKESDANLYLALVVGDTTTVLEAGKTASKTVTIAGVDGNFETTYNATTEKYEYTEKGTLASAWNTSSFYLTGVASKASAENVSAPTLTVTWKYADPAAASSAPSLSATKISATANSVTVSNGTVSSVVLNKTNNTTSNLSEGTHYSVEDNTLTFIATSMLSNNVGATITVSFEEGGTATLTIE